VLSQVCGIVLPLELLALLLERPTDDSVELAVEFIKECGMVLSSLSSQVSAIVVCFCLVFGLRTFTNRF
jgi:hypothetical protein